MKATPYQNVLSINHQAKAVPYGGAGVQRKDGHANYGFRNLKQDPTLTETIPELMADSCLRSLVVAIADQCNGLFTIGCASGDVAEIEGSRRTGYVEFAINSKSGVENAANYFPLFFHFDRLLHSSKFSHPVQFSWELQPARFGAVNVAGFTCSIFVNTHFCTSIERARECWAAALRVIEQHLATVPLQHGEPIYGGEAG